MKINSLNNSRSKSTINNKNNQMNNTLAYIINNDSRCLCVMANNTSNTGVKL